MGSWFSGILVWSGPILGVSYISIRKYAFFPLRICFPLFLKYGLVILKNPLLFLMHLHGTRWLHTWLFFPTYQHLEIQFKSNYLEISIPNFGRIVHILYKNYPEVFYCKHAMVCFESMKADMLNFQFLLLWYNFFE